MKTTTENESTLTAIGQALAGCRGYDTSPALLAEAAEHESRGEKAPLLDLYHDVNRMIARATSNAHNGAQLKDALQFAMRQLETAVHAIRAMETEGK